MFEFLKLAAAVVVLSIIYSAILAKLFVVLARSDHPREPQTRHNPASGEKSTLEAC
jgi:hypothetical protein